MTYYYFFKVLFILKAIEKMKKECKQGSGKSKSGDKSLNIAEADGNSKEMQDREPGTSHLLLLECMHLDLSSLSSTVEFVAEFKQTGYPLHVLICNAGIAFANQGLHTKRQTLYAKDFDRFSIYTQVFL